MSSGTFSAVSIFRILRGAVLLSLGVVIAACAGKPSISDSGQFYDSAYNDHNRAPASCAPKISAGESGSTLDPLYMRTQADYFFSMGESYSLEGKHDKAVESFKMVQIYDAESAHINLRLSAEYVKLGLVSEALEQAEIAVKKQPKLADARILLGGLYSTLKHYSKAIEQYEEALKIDRNNPEAPLYLGAVYAEQKQYDKAVKFFESLVKNEDYSTPYLAYYYIGRVRMEQEGVGAKKAAEAAFKKSLELKPNYVESVLVLGSLYVKMNQEDKALQFYKTFQREQGPHPRVAEVLSQMYLEREQYDLAYEQLEVLEGNSDDSLNIKVRMALILIEQKKYNVAIEKLVEILKQVPESDKIQFYLAAIYEETEQKEKAVEYFSKIAPESTFFAEATVHSTYLLKSEKKIEEALKVAENAYLNRKDLPQMYAVYASLLDEKKAYKKASEVLKSGLEKFPDQVQLKFFMGTIQDRLGDKEQVIYQMKQVVEMDPNHVQGLNYLAFTYADSGKNLEEAEGLVRRALEIEPHDGYILDTLGWVLFKRGQFDESIRVLETAYKSQPNESVIAEHLGDVYSRSHFNDKAKKMYQKAAELGPDDPKLQELRAKISALEKQEASGRMPASSLQGK
jgi:tetratricopeptide (TPR) repeat protein